MITESWLKDGNVLDRDVVDLEWGTDLKIIYRNRPRNPTGRRTVGGGVSIIYNKSRCNLRERKVRGNKFELVIAVGRVGTIPRQAAFICVYLEPRMKVGELAALCDIISREILMIKAKSDALIFIGGDLNRKSLDAAISDFPDIVQVNNQPTRGDACLDIMFSNAPDLSPCSWPPLETREGIRSDHLCIVFSGTIQKERNFEWIRKTARKHSDAALSEYASRLQRVDWDALLPHSLNAEGMIRRFEEWNEQLADELFPLQTIRCRSNEAPWVTGGIRSLSRHKKRVYKREGKSAHWFHLDARMQQLTSQSKAQFVDQASTGGTSTRKYYSAVRALGSAAPKPEWSLVDLFPGRSAAQAGEEAADYFTRITDNFRPLQPGRPCPGGKREHVTVQEVATKLKLAKKPNSSVSGDILPRVVKAHHPLIAYPVTKIFNKVFDEGEWPAAWKTETTVVIPKIPNPETLADCRNISCTPFLSKVMESILLDDLRKEIPDDIIQYGGLKGSSVDHLLVDLLDRALQPLEEGGASLVLGIDFEKAFNRLNHEKCLLQLSRLGASEPSLALVRSFLTGRQMRVRVGQLLSTGKALNGGSPQGSILGCYLYCAATQMLNHSIPFTLRPQGALPVELSPSSPGSETDGDDDHSGFNLMNGMVPGNDSSGGSFLTADGSLESGSSFDSEVDGAGRLTSFKYVDDTTVVESVARGEGIRHITAANPTEHIPATLLAPFFDALIRGAEGIDMKINCRKTQLLCYSVDNGYKATATISAQGETIVAQDSMKLLGYMLGTAPGATDQVNFIKKKFRAKFWSLIHLRKANIKERRLFKLYAAIIRPVLETNCVVFHPMLTVTQSNELERLQKQVVRLCFGHNRPYDDICLIHNIKTLRERREERIRKFTAKAMANERWASKWFKNRPGIDPELRNRRPFVELRARTERYRKSPLLQLQRTANDIATAIIA